jgi:Tfp pilus assembly protein PilN
MRAVNLLPKDANRSAKSFRREDPAVVIGSALGAVVMVALVGGFLNVHGKVGRNQQQLDAARAEYAQLSLHKVAPEPTKQVKQKPIIPVPAVTSEEGPRLTAVSSVLGTRISWDRILREFSLVLPSDVTITSLTMAAPAAADPTTGAPSGSGDQGFSIAGSAFSHDGVARLLSRLMLIPDLENVTLGNSTAGSNGSAGVQFSITASIKGAVAPAVDTAPPVATTPATTTTSGASS